MCHVSHKSKNRDRAEPTERKLEVGRLGAVERILQHLLHRILELLFATRLKRAISGC